MHHALLFPTSLWKFQLPLGSPARTVLAVQRGTPSFLCGGLRQWGKDEKQAEIFKPGNYAA